jgi:hypothetical protein
MLETLRAYGARKLAEAGEHQDAASALARYAVEVAGQAEAGLQTNSPREAAAARWLDAEDAMMRQVLGWAVEHDPAAAARLAAALGWWRLRGRLAAEYGLLGQITARTETGSNAAQPGHQHPAPGRPHEHRRRQPPPRPRPAANAKAASGWMNTTLPGPSAQPGD